jgi:hypothetical protein
MSKFLEWVSRNRQKIGYTVGGLNLLAALNHLVLGQWGLAILWFVIGGFLIYDAKEFK